MPMATPMSAFLSEGASFTPSPVMLVGLNCIHQAKFVLGARTREHVDITNALLQGGGVHILDLGAGDCCLAVADTKHLGDCCSGDFVITRDHRDANAAAVAFLDGLNRFLARRIEKADQAEQDEGLRQVGWSKTAGLDTR